MSADIGRIETDVDRSRTVSGVCVVIFGSADEVSRSVLSVLKQDHPRDEIEILVLTGKGSVPAEWAAHPQLRFPATPHPPGLSVLDALRIACAGTDRAWVTPLRAGDELDRTFLRALFLSATPRTDIVAGHSARLDPDFGDLIRDTPSLSALKSLKGDPSADLAGMMPLFDTPYAKLYRREVIDAFEPDATVDDRGTLDLVAWAETIARLDGNVAPGRALSPAAYVDRSPFSSPAVDPRREIENAVSSLTRLESIVFDGSLEWDRKVFAVEAVHELNRRISDRLERIDPGERDALKAVILEHTSPLINRSLLGEVRAVAFCQGFPPYSNAASINASQRLDEIAQREGTTLDWHVIRADMRDRFNTDEHYRRSYADLHVSTVDVVGEMPSANEAAQMTWGHEAAAFARDLPAEVIYSLSMQPGAHLAAYRYKRDHPDVKWYAEFTDPIHMTSSGRPRTISRTYGGEHEVLNDFWRALERVVYEHADVIIFTNHHQMHYMLDHACPPGMRGAVEAKSLMLPHPRIDARYVHVDPPEYVLDPSVFNIGYFGTFYEGDESDATIERILSNPQAHLHVFTKPTGRLIRLQSNHPDRISISPLYPYLQFLNLASRMDYLLLLHRPFPGEEDPYITSKWHDYDVAGRPIVSDTPANSPLLKLPVAERILSVDDLLADMERRSDELPASSDADEASAPDGADSPVVEAAGIERPEPPTVTAVMATWRPTPYLEAAVRSFLDQVYPHGSLRLIIAVNGSDTAYLETLQKTYGGDPRVEVIHTSTPGIGAADNLAIRHLETEWFLKLDDDDLLSPRFVEDLVSRAAPDVDIVLGRLEEMSADGSTFTRRTGISRVIEDAARMTDELRYFDPEIRPHFSPLTAKLMRSTLFKERFGPRSNEVSHAGDSLFWVNNAHLIEGRIVAVSTDSPEAYLRRLTEDSVSRPDAGRVYDQSVTSRLDLIDRFSEEILGENRPYDHRKYVATRILTQNAFVRTYFNEQDDQTRGRIRTEVHASWNPLVNKGWFSDRTGIIIATSDEDLPDSNARSTMARLIETTVRDTRVVKWALSVFSSSPDGWKNTGIQSFLLPFAVASHQLHRLPAEHGSHGLEAFISARVLDSDGVDEVMTLGPEPESHAAAIQIKLLHPDTSWRLVLPSGVDAADLDDWRTLIEAADTVIVETEEQRDTILDGVPSTPDSKVTVVAPRGMPSWYNRVQSAAVAERAAAREAAAQE